MSGQLIAGVVIGSFAIYIATAYAARLRAVARRGGSVARAGGFAAWSPYLVWLPYVVVALRPGPELVMPDGVRAAGLVLAVAGVAFALWSVRTLGQHFDLELELHRGHEIVRRGPYALVRHPIYSGLALHFIGACLATGNVLLIVGTLCGSFPAFWLRARAEEDLLRRELGGAYDDYARDVPMLVPRLRPR